MSSRIAVIGGGPAGYEAALVAAELGAAVTVVTDEGLGGNCVLWDCVPSKALIVAAEAMGWLATAGRLGIDVSGGDGAARVDYPRVTAEVLELGVSQSADIERRLRDGGVEIVQGRGRVTRERRVDVACADGSDRQVDADHVLVATGSTPRVLDFAPPDGERILTGQQIYGLDHLPEHLVVVGSGATGAEFAHAFCRFGSRVTLVSSRDLILPTEDPDAAQVIEDVFERRGMTIVRRARAVSCARDGDRVVVGLDDGRSIEASHALFTVGQIPATQNLGLEDVGVELGPSGGIQVDRVSRTSVPWIYAAGDVTGRMMLASVAAMQGRTAMWHALGQALEPIRWDSVAATVFTDPEVSTVGRDPQAAADAGMPVATARLDFRRNPRAKMIHGTDGFVKVHAMVGSGTIVGAVVVSARSSDLIQPLAVAVQNRLTVEQLARTITVYPSMAGSIAECARMLMSRLDEA
ncbi:MAG: NAD(P)H-quinone dehydrogenase [Nitriliruptoraceae bacterium]